jgi:cytidylate kinase
MKVNPMRDRQTHQPTVDLRQFPRLMQVAIEGRPTITKRTVGEVLAEKLGAVLVDTERFYASFTKSCRKAGVDLGDVDALGDYCGKARVDVCVRRENPRFVEALIFLNGDLFNDAELASVSGGPWRIEYAPRVKDHVRRAVLELAETTRIVVMGRGIIPRILPATPFKFFIDSPNPLDALEMQFPQSSGPCFRYSSGDFDNPDDVFFVPIGPMKLEKALTKIFAEMENQLHRHRTGQRP